MNNITKRYIAFLGLCIPSRALLTYIAKTIDTKYLPYMTLFTLPASIGFLKIYFFGSAKADRQLEWADGRVWWNELRVIFGLIYFSFSLCALFKVEYSWIFLLVDVIVGLVSFLIYHLIVKN
uniref:Uncharacterized protein n=1 Tax=Megaviridae environmental sample TaxID=1737588 RepID=A0A5J6VK34_9VIRU|nr:MAG: hypothetical protein [Megaviridae environmental sample]